jgi:hypothetical protein
MRLHKSVITGKASSEFRRLLTEGPWPLDLEHKYLSAEALARYEQSLGVYDPRDRPNTLDGPKDQIP